jgi:hypothetical protein
MDNIHNFIVKQNRNGCYYLCSDEFFLTLNYFAIKMGMSHNNVLNILTSVYYGKLRVSYVVFDNENDAKLALEWIESIMVMKKLSKS